jgi:hypothetical protein
LTKTSTSDSWEVEKEFKTIEELMEFVRKSDQEVIIKAGGKYQRNDGSWYEWPDSLEIYDDYRE